MAPPTSDTDAMFPALDAGQIERLAPFARHRTAQKGEVLFEQGDAVSGMFVVISGSIDIVSPTSGHETIVTVHRPGDFTGEVSLISGRRSLVRGLATETSELLEIDRPSLRRIVQTDPELSEIFLRAFILRRLYLIRNRQGDALIVGSSHSSDTLRLKEFLTRNSHPHTYSIRRQTGRDSDSGVPRQEGLA
jgi:thioredoxin reductase (NADPH)